MSEEISPVRESSPPRGLFKAQDRPRLPIEISQLSPAITSPKAHKLKDNSPILCRKGTFDAMDDMLISPQSKPLNFNPAPTPQVLFTVNKEDEQLPKPKLQKDDFSMPTASNDDPEKKTQSVLIKQ